MLTSQTNINRTSLVDLLGIRIKTETPEERAVSIRVLVDKRLAKLFGAKFFLGYDWNLFMPQYSLEELDKMIKEADIKIPVEEIVKERLSVSKRHDDFYYFNPVINSQDVGLFKLAYRREEITNYRGVKKRPYAHSHLKAQN